MLWVDPSSKKREGMGMVKRNPKVWHSTLLCNECGGAREEKFTKIKGIKLRGDKCRKCGRWRYEQDQLKKFLLELNAKIKKRKK